ncbi:MAG: branched-chain amino acid ABC transporter permease [Clostridiales bacterium]|nr:branched-chain amino acid ABC transporter permease [Clostridiales bacterium]
MKRLPLGGGASKLLRYALPAVLLLLMPQIFRKFPYGMMILCFCEIYVIAVTGLDVLYGYSGQISFATSAFFGIGAYGSLLLHNHTGIPIIFTMLLASAISCLVAMAFAYPVSKLRFAFLSLSTISFNYIVFLLVTRSPGGITGDFNGTFTKRMNLFGLDLKGYPAFYYFGLVCVVIFVILKFLLVRSRVGRAFLAIKQNTHAADGMGINVRKYKVYAFGFYAFYAAFAGSMYVHLVGFVSPETVAQPESVAFMIMILLGGVCSNWGPVLGAVVVVLLKEVLGYAEQYQLLAYGVILLVFILFLPRGIVGETKRLFEYLRNRREVARDAQG